MKHTPGPWFVTSDAMDACYIATEHPQGDMPIATVFVDSGRHSENARLISAAPELLEALCSIYYMANLEPHLKTKYSSQTVAMIMQQIADAIAKATGGDK